ncbi:MAG: hypothetical protein QME66_05560 [Candidatus Eisenbacteria bacterium]|nr:hypothetical protein [Candidatus Eisenbacteria bacterium]
METQAEPVTAAVVPSEIMHSIIVERAPDLVLAEAKHASIALTEVIRQKPKQVRFGGEQYLEFEDWQLLGRFYGLSVRIVESSVRYVEYGDVHGFEATAEVLRNADSAVISAASAMCLNDEQNWRSKPLFQLKSMAQTRACAKAFRNVLSWVAVLAGFRPTPAEEMDGVFPAEPFPTKNPARKAPQGPTMPLESTETHQSTDDAIREVFPVAEPVAPPSMAKKPIEKIVANCAQCETGITDAVLRYSQKKHGRPLCFIHQKSMS